MAGRPADKPFAGIIFDLNGAPLTMEEMKHHVHGRANRDIFTYVLGRAARPDFRGCTGDRSARRGSSSQCIAPLERPRQWM
jgi:hypothetical protein